MKTTQLRKMVREQVRKMLKENAIYDGQATLQPGTKFQMTGYTTTVIKDLGDKLEVKIDLPQYNKTGVIKKDIFKGATLLPGSSSLMEVDDLESKLESSANVSDLNVLHAKLRMLTTEWMSKGFQKQDVVQYLTTFIDNI